MKANFVAITIVSGTLAAPLAAQPSEMSPDRALDCLVTTGVAAGIVEAARNHGEDFSFNQVEKLKFWAEEFHNLALGKGVSEKGIKSELSSRQPGLESMLRDRGGPETISILIGRVNSCIEEIKR